MSGKSLVIVESPTKAKTITKFLGKDFVVRASNGHIRDLPNSAAEIPAKYKKEKWARLGVNVDKNFEALYVIPNQKKDHVKQLKELLRDASVLYLATDEDREGESISWHLVETLEPTIPIKRLVFHEITKEAIQHSLESARDIDENLVRAQETRRIVDRLYGYEVSPLLWKKMVPGLSAGRVQSVAIRLLVEREHERIKFKKASFWGLKAKFSKLGQSDDQFIEAELTQVGDKKVAIGKDFDPTTGKLLQADKVVALSEIEAESLKERVMKSTPKVDAVEEKPYVTKPSAPFVTSSLQQEANRKLRLSAKRTMQIAQQLYENGFITYMRTDSTTLSEQALAAARSLIKRDFGDPYLPPTPRLYSTKVRNAQEAHEAIRPAGDSFTPPDVVREKLGPEAFRLYEMIWMRTVASQMTDARGTHIAIFIGCADAKFRAAGKTIEFPGFLRAYVEGTDDPDAELADQEKVLPKVDANETLNNNGVDATEHTTQPPPRFTEGSLIKELERLGIGRPSTWATIVEVVLSRSYAFKKGNALVPTFTAFAVVSLLQGHFTRLLDYEFTARLEDDLDAIARGEAANLDYLKNFYFGNGHSGLKSLVQAGEKEIDPRKVCGVPLGILPSGTPIEVRIGRYGPFITDGTRRAGIPEAMAPDELTVDAADKMLSDSSQAPESLGLHPESGEEIYLKVGPYGPYVQHGLGSEGVRPKMASLLNKNDVEKVDLEHALKLLSLPRTLGNNPDNNEPVVAANGRFGPYIKCGADTRSIPPDLTTPIDITLEQAMELLRQPKTGRRSAKPSTLRELGNHPVTELPLKILSGRYGPYVSDGTLNASLQKDSDPNTLTMEEAVHLLEARAAKGPSQKRGRKKAAPKASKEKKSTGKAKGRGKQKPTEGMESV